jgi:hypothetical protein
VGNGMRQPAFCRKTHRRDRLGARVMNQYLKWGFVEAATCSLRFRAYRGTYVERLYQRLDGWPIQAFCRLEWATSRSRGECGSRFAKAHAGFHGEYMIPDETTSRANRTKNQNHREEKRDYPLPNQPCPPRPRKNTQLREKQKQDLPLDNVRFHTWCVQPIPHAKHGALQRCRPGRGFSGTGTM